MSNQGLYRQLFELSADAHLIIENNRFVDCNEATLRMLGYPNKQSLLDTHPSELSPPQQPGGQSSEKKADKMMALARKKGSHRFLWNHQRANGDIFPVEVLLTYLVTKTGQEQIHTVWRDITQRVQYEEDLASSEARFRSYIENAPLGIIISNRSGQVIDVNTEASRLSGFSKSRLKAGEHSRVTAPENLERVASHLQKVAKHTSFSEVLIYTDLHGNERVWAVSSVRLSDDRFSSFITDITERHRIVKLQEKLKDCANDLLSTLSPPHMARAASKHLQAYFSSDALGIWYGDDKHRIDKSLYMEDTPMGGDAPQEYPAETHPYTEGFDSSAPERIRAHLLNRTQAELDQKKAVATVSAQERVSASIIFAPILWEGKRIGVISVHSYTLDHFTEKDLNDLQLFSTLIGSALQRAFVFEQLNETLEEKEILLRELQHRTRNNMNVIISLLNMQANELENEQLKGEFKVIEDRIYAMSTAYNKLQQGRSLNVIELRDYLMALAGSLFHSSSLSPNDVKLVMELDDVSIHLEQAVPVGLVFNEVMSNAVSHAFPLGRSGTIQINLTVDDDLVTLIVRDDGVGITPQHLEKAKVSMGFRIIDMLASDQLNGEHEFQTSEGCEHTLKFRLQSLKKPS